MQFFPNISYTSMNGHPHYICFFPVGSDEALFLLATCYYRAGKATKAYRLLEAKGCPSAQCKFLMARCCCDIEK